MAEASGSWEAADVDTVAEPDGAGWRLTGVKHHVVEGDVVDELVVVARTAGSRGDDGVGLFVVPRASVVVRPTRTFDASRHHAVVELDGVTVGADRVLGAPGPAAAAALRRALEEAVVGLALEMVGTCQAILDRTVTYAEEREQFGVPIGSFQAVKHKLADMLVAVERARACAYFAAACIAEDDARRPVAAAMAKAAAGDAQRLVTQDGIQLHGGIGYTWEHDLHLWVKRAKSGDATFGTAADHRARLADLIGL
jgi:alkylation response protein AidB-like acyl-CoA dehydrogenase